MVKALQRKGAACTKGVLDQWTGSRLQNCCTALLLRNNINGETSDTRIWLDDLGCTTSHSTLLSCPHNGIGVHDCIHSDDVALACGPANSSGTISTNTPSMITRTPMSDLPGSRIEENSSRPLGMFSGRLTLVGHTSFPQTNNSKQTNKQQEITTTGTPLS